jgi:tRNA(fMet)-specific endonuclease VapC
VSGFLLDTNIWIALARGDPDVIARLREHNSRDIACCSIVRAELVFGARKSRRVEENLLGLERLLAPFRSFHFDDVSAEHYGLIRFDLERTGRPIGGNDLLIAAIARAHDLVLVTRNGHEFVRVPGLRLTRW